MAAIDGQELLNRDRWDTSPQLGTRQTAKLKAPSTSTASHQADMPYGQSARGSGPSGFSLCKPLNIPWYAAHAGSNLPDCRASGWRLKTYAAGVKKCYSPESNITDVRLWSINPLCVPGSAHLLFMYLRRTEVVTIPFMFHSSRSRDD